MPTTGATVYSANPAALAASITRRRASASGWSAAVTASPTGSA